MPALPLDQNIPAGTKIAIPLSFTEISLGYSTISEQDIVTACADTGNFSATSFSFDILSGAGVSESGTLYGTVSADDDGNDILQQISKCLNQFHTLVGLNLKEIDTASSSSGPGFMQQLLNQLGLGTGLQTTANYVVIILIIIVAGIFFLGKAKNVRIGI